jgi:hypothetical protein
VKEDELVAAGKKIGADKLLLMLQNKIPCDDPDLQPSPRHNWPYKKMSLFVLSHAGQLLRPEDSDALLECERWHRDFEKHGISDPTITSWWAVAAAHLKPQNAPRILHAALDYFQRSDEADESARLCIALWELGGESEAGFLEQWFYNDNQLLGAYPESRVDFIRAMGADPNGKPMIARLIANSKLDYLDWESLEQFVRVINGWSETPIMTDDQLDEARHHSEAGRGHPRGAAELRAVLNKWYQHWCASMPKSRDANVSSFILKNYF